MIKVNLWRLYVETYRDDILTVNSYKIRHAFRTNCLAFRKLHWRDSFDGGYAYV